MSVVRIGATKKYSDNWDNIFSGGKRSSAATKMAVKPARRSDKKTPKAAKKTASKKRSGGLKRKRK